jgi:hypothetical protein
MLMHGKAAVFTSIDIIAGNVHYEHLPLASRAGKLMIGYFFGVVVAIGYDPSKRKHRLRFCAEYR